MAIKKRKAVQGDCEVPTNTLGVVFGVRHLSPCGGYHLEKLIRDLRPTAVLIEGPTDANHLLPWFAHQETVPPVAVLAYTRQLPALSPAATAKLGERWTKNRRVPSIFYPFARYSPEIVAAVEGAAVGADVRFMDLPTDVWFGESLLEEAAEITRRLFPEHAPPPVKAHVKAKAKRAPSPDTERYIDDPWRAIAELVGAPDYEAWWERSFEHLTEPGAYQDALFCFGLQLRKNDELRPGPSMDRDLRREKYMRRIIRETLAKGHRPDKVVVVCGAAHASKLVEDLPSMTDAELAALERAPSNLALMRYSYRRLSSQSGYGAGNHAPFFYEKIWNSLHSGDHAGAVSTYMAEVRQLIAHHGVLKSPADSIEATRLAASICKLRGSQTPVLTDLHDAVSSVFLGGEEGLMRVISHELEIGHALGRLPKSMPEELGKTPLVEDFYHYVETFGLGRCLESKTEGAGCKGLKVSVPVHPTSQSELFAREEYIFLQRMKALRIGFASMTQKRRLTSGRVALDESLWDVAWSEEVEMSLIIKSTYGNSIREACVSSVKEDAERITSFEEAIAIADIARECDIPEFVRDALRRARELLATDGVFASLANGCVGLIRQGYDVIDRKESPELAREIAGLVDSSYVAAIARLYAAAQCDPAALADPAQPQAGTLCMKSARALRDLALRTGELSDFKNLILNVNVVAGDQGSSPVMAGACLAVLLMNQEAVKKTVGVDVEAAFEGHARTWLTPLAAPERTAYWIQGLLMTDQESHQREFLWRAIDGIVQEQSDEAFMILLVCFRRALEKFSKSRRDDIARLLARLWGVSETDVVSVMGAKLSKKEEEELFDAEKNF